MQVKAPGSFLHQLLPDPCQRSHHAMSVTSRSAELPSMPPSRPGWMLHERTLRLPEATVSRFPKLTLRAVSGDIVPAPAHRPSSPCPKPSRPSSKLKATPASAHHRQCRHRRWFRALLQDRRDRHLPMPAAPSKTAKSKAAPPSTAPRSASRSASMPSLWSSPAQMTS